MLEQKTFFYIVKLSKKLSSAEDLISLSSVLLSTVKELTGETFYSYDSSLLQKKIVFSAALMKKTELLGCVRELLDNVSDRDYYFVKKNILNKKDIERLQAFATTLPSSPSILTLPPSSNKELLTLSQEPPTPTNSLRCLSSLLSTTKPAKLDSLVEVIVSSYFIPKDQHWVYDYINKTRK